MKQLRLQRLVVSTKSLEGWAMKAGCAPDSFIRFSCMHISCGERSSPIRIRVLARTTRESTRIVTVLRLFNPP
jgi:hypothetical protein